MKLIIYRTEKISTKSFWGKPEDLFHSLKSSLLCRFANLLSICFHWKKEEGRYIRSSNREIEKTRQFLKETRFQWVSLNLITVGLSPVYAINLLIWSLHYPTNTNMCIDPKSADECSTSYFKNSIELFNLTWSRISWGYLSKILKLINNLHWLIIKKNEQTNCSKCRNWIIKILMKKRKPVFRTGI